MGSFTITLLVLAVFLVSSYKCEYEEFVWRTKGGIIKVEPLCGATETDVSEINVYADFPVLVQIFCKNGRTVNPTSDDGVKYSQIAAFSSDNGHDCVFEKKRNSGVYTVTVKVGWEEGAVSINQAREFFLIDCSYDDKVNLETNRELIDTQRQMYDEIVHNMGPPLENTSMTFQVVNVRGRQLENTSIPLGRIIKLQAVVDGPMPVRPVSCVATNGMRDYRVLLGGCGDGLVFKKVDGFVTIGSTIISPFFVAFRLPGSREMSFKCNFTVCADKATCDGNSCYKANKTPIRVRRDDDLPSQSEVETGPAPSNKRRHRRSVCRVDQSAPQDTTSGSTRCLDTRHRTVHM